MRYLIVKDGVVHNIIVCDSDEVAAKFDSVPYYDGAVIGATYNPPESEPTTDELLNAMLGVNRYE